MPKKTFKGSDGADVLDKMLTGTVQAKTPKTTVAKKTQQTQRTHQTSQTHETHKPYKTHQTHETHKTHKTYNQTTNSYRINLRLAPDHREYLEDMSWSNRISITDYINNLIEADKAKNQSRGGKQ
jgi:ABC-type uncharacterized transport system auxiliary subunit